MTKQHLLSLVLAGALGASPAWAGEQRAPGFAADFLVSHFAQTEYDWKRASENLNKVLEKDPHNSDLLRRAMILAMGAGDLTQASARARALVTKEKDDNLAILILTVNDFANNDIDGAEKTLATMPDGDITAFIKPILAGWVKAEKNQTITDEFTTTTIHAYSGGLIALYKGDKEKAAEFAAAITGAGGISPYDAERAGDLYAAADKLDKALAAYQGAYEASTNNWQLDNKITAIKENRPDDLKKLLPALRIKTPARGVAVAMFDMARLLFQEESDTSAKLFAHMTLALNPDFNAARFLLADNLARNGRYDEAIEYFSGISPDDRSWLDVQRHIAGLLQEAGRTKEALALYEKLFTEKNDIESLVRIGDLYRDKEDYAAALKAYNRAASHIGETIPEKYWYLLYARGMAYEREGDWSRAESDLKAALVYRPEHPYLMNYLGYGWADQGLNLEESLKLIERAAALRPADGYITDSLGWVQYMMGLYSDAVSSLEKAVELMPYDPTLNDHLGDAYWRVGRKVEAKFQWERALNNADADETLKTSLREKLDRGLPAATVKEAHTHAPETKAR